MLTALNSIPAKVCIAALCTSAVSISVLTDSANAISLIGNLGTGSSAPTNINKDNFLSVQFKTPNLPTVNDKFRLNSIRLKVTNFRTVDGDTVYLSITDNDNANTAPGTASLFENFNAPGSITTGLRTLQFLPQTTFFFERNTTYWLLVGTLAGASTFDWVANDANTAPTGLASLGAGGYKYTTDGGANYTNGLNNAAFDIDVTQVPFEFEASGGLVILGGLFLARRLKARKKDNNVA